LGEWRSDILASIRYTRKRLSGMRLSSVERVSELRIGSTAILSDVEHTSKDVAMGGTHRG
jgi:hypothetical protein